MSQPFFHPAPQYGITKLASVARLKPSAGLLCAAGLLAGCNSEGPGYDSGYDTTPPKLSQLEIIDTLGYSNTGRNGPFTNTPSVLHFRNDGYFELYWEQEHFDRYDLTLYINDRNSLSQAIEIARKSCSPSRCNGGDWANCYYSQTSNGANQIRDSLNCVIDNGDEQDSVITSLFSANTANQALFLLIEACDEQTGSCNLTSAKAFFE